METVHIKPENQRRLTVKTSNDGQGVSASTGFTVKKVCYLFTFILKQRLR